MNESWTLIKTRFDAEAGRFSPAAQATRSVSASPEAEDIVWRSYLERRKKLEAAIVSVVGYVPENDTEASAKLDVGGELMNLCHRLDETWIEAYALEILPGETWAFPGNPRDAQRSGSETVV